MILAIETISLFFDSVSVKLNSCALRDQEGVSLGADG